MKKIIIAVSLVVVHALLVKGVVTGKLEFFSVEHEPILFWLDVIFSGFCLLAVDFVVARHVLSARREKA